MEHLQVPFKHKEIMAIVYLLDPQHTNIITIHSLVSFHRTILDKVILSSSIIMFILYPTVTRSLFKLISCRDQLTPTNGLLYLVSDLELQCYTPIHMVFVICVGVPGLLLYILGFPLVSVFAMYGGHKTKKEDDLHPFTWDDRSLFRYSMFLNGYKVEKFYWECIIALRKSLLTFISVFFGSLGVHAQSYFGLVVIFLGMMVHVANTPFVTGTLNYLETMALSISFLTLYFGLMFFSGWLDRPQEILISTIILGINILFNLYAFSIIFKTTISELIEDYKRSRLPKADQMNTKKQIKNGKSSKVKVSPSKQRAQEAWDLDQDSDEDDS